MTSELVTAILKGDVLAAARLIRGIEDGTPDAMAALGDIYLHTGHAYVIGLTGAPGAGKSTLIGSLISYYRSQEQKTIGVVAIDPTSPYTGGAVLGDRIRMQGKKVDEGVFIRSLASRGWKGGLSRATIDTVHVMDAMGKEIILVEAVGSGQGEIDIQRVADTCVVVLTPGMGDEIQMMKAGILEVADVFAINKADRQGAEDLKRWLESAIGTRSGWRPGTVLTEAVFNKGAGDLAAEIEKHRQFLASSGELEKRRRERVKLELMMAVESALNSRLEKTESGVLEGLIEDLISRRTDPQTAAEKIISQP